ncbi:MAG TPA: 5-deoxy-glucuronate isomerase, partial [Thermoanaerobaculia bacterium]|nr:5-deoxy-glucuronate isomerase [Thermoanaerobaculia bacterium]
MTRLAKIKEKTCVVRKTGSRRGRHISVTPKKTSARHLHFGRIVLSAADKPVKVSTGDRETAFICLTGSATIEVGSGSNVSKYDVTRYYALYVPRKTKVKVLPGGDGCDFAELSAPVSNAYP